MIALSTGSLYNYGIARVARLAAAAGFDGLEIMVDDRWDTRDPAHLREAVGSAGIPILSLHAPFRAGIQGWAEDEVARVHRTVDLARAVGARTVVIHPPLRYQWIVVRAAPFFTAALLTPFRRVSRYHRWLRTELEPYRARAGVTIALENMPRHRLGPWLVNLFAMNEIRDLRRVSAVAFDTTHVGTWGIDLLDTYEVLANRIVHVHISNYDKGRQHRLPGEGSLPLSAFLTALRKRGFGGVITVELEPDSAGAGDEGRVRERLAAAATFCREHFV